MYYDRERHELSLFHCMLLIRVPRWPVAIDLSQVRIYFGVTCPRHRRLLKHRLGWFGRFLNDRVWVYDEHGREVLVSVKDGHS